MTSLDLADRARAILAEHALSRTAQDRYMAMADRTAMRQFIIWCHELGDYGIRECIKRLYNLGYRGRELDLAWKP
jgi:hypothetical protein